MVFDEKASREMIQEALKRLGNEPWTGDLGPNAVLRARGLPERIFFFETAKRLMPHAARQIKEAAARGRSFHSCACYWASSLEEARGRMKRSWWSPPGGIYLCISLYPQLLSENMALYSLSAGLAVCQCVRDLGFEAEIRWVNDVVIRGKKVCGILTRTVEARQTGEQYLLFGIGLNVNVTGFPAELANRATSLLAESGRKWPLHDLGIRLMSRLVFCFCLLHEWESRCLGEADSDRAENPVLSLYRRLSNMEGRKVVYGRDLETEEGIVCVSRGITDRGHIVLERHGEIFTAETGEIRLL